MAINPRARIALVIIAAIVVGLLVWVFAGRDDDDGGGESLAALGASLRPGAGPVEVSSGDLTELQRKLNTPVYWAGDQGEGSLELTRTGDDRVFVRYLDQGASAGDPEPDYLTVGTYPLKNAFDAVERATERNGAIVEDAPDGGVVVTNEDSRTSVYIGYPGEDLQIEVYDPDPERALDLATSGQIEPVD